MHPRLPKPHSPIAVLAEAVDAIEGSPMQLKLSEPVVKLFDTLGRYAAQPYRTIFANVGAFLPVLDLIGRKSGGNLNALMRTTVALTQMKGSAAPNVIPPKAEIVTNIRVNPEDTVEDVMEYLRQTVDDPQVSIEMIEGWDASPVSRTDCEGYARVAYAVANTWTDCIVARMSWSSTRTAAIIVTCRIACIASRPMMPPRRSLQPSMGTTRASASRRSSAPSSSSPGSCASARGSSPLFMHRHRVAQHIPYVM